MTSAPKCVVDNTRPCGACSAPGPDQCPYGYLLDPEDFAAIAALAARHAADDARPPERSGPAGPPD